MRQRWHLFVVAIAFGCAGPRLAPGAPPQPPAASPRAPAVPGQGNAPASTPALAPAAPPRASPASRGMTQDDVQRVLGSPTRVESAVSSTAQGARYERWVYPGQEIVFLDGRVVDVVIW